jgi:hypothetical protein
VNRKIIAALALLLLPAIARAQIFGFPRNPTFGTVTASTSVLTPVIGTLTATDVNFLYANTNIVTVSGLNMFPAADGTTNLGNGALRWKDVFLSGTLSSTKACATGYVRTSPNYCRASNAQVGAFNFGWGDAVACTARTLPSSALPADAKMAYIAIEWLGLSNNAIGQRANSVVFYNDAACTAAQAAAGSTAAFREQVAVVAGTTLGFVTDHLMIPLVATNTFRTTQANAGGNGNATLFGWSIEGYSD